MAQATGRPAISINSLLLGRKIQDVTVVLWFRLNGLAVGELTAPLRSQDETSQTKSFYRVDGEDKCGCGPCKTADCPPRILFPIRLKGVS